MEHIFFANTRLEDGFWGYYDQLVRKVTVKSVYGRLKETGRFDALQCSWKPGMPNMPHVYWDSDTAKWIEAVAYLTEMKREPAWEAIVDQAAEFIEANQKPSGYFNSYYLTVEPGVEFQNRNNHELYCAGHLIEAAIAYHRATGKDKLLQCMRRYADYIYKVFYEQHSAAFVTPGHEEIELALLKLYDYTGEQRYLELARFFLLSRGIGSPADISNAEHGPKTDQSDRPVTQIHEAWGHAVRACYLYTAMAACARKTGNAQLLEVCRTVLKDITEKKLSITGGVGACSMVEAFGSAYELPSMTSYNETCAAIALSLFAHELQLAGPSAACADLIERIWYNGALSGISLSGDAFFYENALEIDLRCYQHPYLDTAAMDTIQTRAQGVLSHQRLQRAKAFDCFCCPPNLARMLSSITRFAYSVDGSTVYCHQFMQGTATLTVGGKSASLELQTDYPISGALRFTYRGAPAVLAVRIPDWCTEYADPVEDGYARFPVTDGQVVALTLPMQIHFIEADPRVRDCSGRCAVMRGPIVYCLEGVDNGSNLSDITLVEDAPAEVLRWDSFPAPVLRLAARRRKPAQSLYQTHSRERLDFTATLIPYFCFANRGISDMQIWTQVQ